VLYCPACGKRLSTTIVPGTVPPPTPPNSPYLPTNIPSTFGDADRKALGKIMIFSTIVLVLLVFSFASSFFLNPFRYLIITNQNSGATPTSFTFAPNYLTIFAVIVVVGIVVETIIYQQLRSAFKGLTTSDRPHFKTPSTLTLLLMIVLPILLLGYLIILSGLQPVLNEISQNGGRTINAIPAGSMGPLLGGALITFIGGILALVGLIGGPILGLWRVGSRYDDTLHQSGSDTAHNSLD